MKGAILIGNGVTALSTFVRGGIDSGLDPGRMARASHAMLKAGCSQHASFPGLFVASYLIAVQDKDGGWADVEETVWCAGYLAALDKEYSDYIEQAKAWLASQRLSCGAWGKSLRDQPRIPITGLMSALVPTVVDRRALEWVADEWGEDLSSQVRLTYKGAFFLLSQKNELAPDSRELVSRTIEYLCAEQNEDGGFGPWKEHPTGSDPWSTGVVLWGLAGFAENVPEQVVKRSISWLEAKQLPNGLWPYHYLDDGTSLALIGLSSAMNKFQSCI